ncbi:tetratricopeptide repeat protein [Treponema sp. OMZ 305]|uniref:tetratricopeptide repeat protein n=1 Tax=Treponema sp. OMZ 305 TaxID=1659192 RepID=UPI0020A4164A|nr:tetratricopeptide repeat protein [Treponema sp. OMZ 305]UTC57159.1 tetratricopeptide repeat protein [Treponema sp. OMZ 305]
MYKLYRYGLLCICFAFMVSSCVSTSSAKRDGGKVQNYGKDGRDILLIFTGSDWSQEAEEFSKNILTESCKTELAKDYAARFIDLLHNPTESERKTAQKNYLLFSEYAVPEVPFVVLQTAERDMYAAAVIEADIKTEAQLIEKIKALTAQRTSVVEARKRINTAKGAEKARAIDEFLNTVGNAEAHRYDSLRMQVPALDPHNKSGLKGKYVLMSADIRAKSFAQQGNYLKAGDEYKAAAETGDLSPAELQLAWYLTAYSYLMAGSADTETVVGYLQKAIQADPQNTAVQQLNQAIHKLQNDIQLKNNER